MSLSNHMNKAQVTSLVLASFLAARAASADWQMPNNPGLPTDLGQQIVNIINWLLGFTALLAVLVIVYSGLVYIASTGDQDRTKDAKKSAKYAIMGLAMAGVAFAVVRLIVGDILR